MNPPDDLLDHCFRHARTAPENPLPDSAPAGFATRVLAHWREAESRDWTLWLLPRAIGAAAVCATAIFTFQALQPTLSDDMELGRLVMNLALEDRP
jgi:hypothetical protein